MTIAELIAFLQKFPPEWTIELWDETYYAPLDENCFSVSKTNEGDNCLLIDGATYDHDPEPLVDANEWLLHGDSAFDEDEIED